jgi:hypothetical protein
MKRSILLAMFLYILAMNTYAANPTAIPTPQKSLKPKTANHVLLHQVNQRIAYQMRLTREGYKSKKLTADQVKTLKLSFVNTRKQALAFIKQNGNQDLTSDQKSQIDTILNLNSSEIGETPSK